MSDQAQNIYAPFPPPERMSVRHFVDDPVTGWGRINSDRYLAIYRSNICVPNWAGKTLRGAGVLVDFDGRKVIAICRVEISNWKIGDEGFTNPDELMEPTADYSDPARPKPARTPESIPTMEDIMAIKRCLGLSG